MTKFNYEEFKNDQNYIKLENKYPLGAKQTDPDRGFCDESNEAAFKLLQGSNRKVETS